MLFKKIKYSVVFRAITILLLHAFFVSNVAFAIEIPTNHTLAIASQLWQKELKERATLWHIEEMREKYERLNISEYTTEKDIDEFKASVGLPVGDGKHVYVRVKRSPDSPIKAHGKDSLTIIKEMIRKKRQELVQQGIKRNLRICLDGDRGVGKTTLSKYLHEKLGFSVVELDDYINPTDSLQEKNWGIIKRKIESFHKDEDIDEILLEGMRVLEAEYFGNIAFDIKIKVIADEETRRENIKKKSPDYYSDTDINRIMLCRAEYPAIKGLSEYRYDLIIENSKDYRAQIKTPEIKESVHDRTTDIQSEPGKGTTLAIRLPVDDIGKTEPELGSATIAFRLMNTVLNVPVKEDFNIMVTYKCPFDCGFCLAKDAKNAGKTRDANKQYLYSIFDQFRGFEKIHIVGTGEPLAYGKDKLLQGSVSEDFLDIVRYAAERIKEVRIVTNGYLIPETPKAAEEFFRQFPKNVVWLLSVDKYHEKQMERRMDKSLNKIVRVMEHLASKDVIKTAYNIRISSNRERNEVLTHFGLKKKLSTDKNNVFINRFIAQGNAEHNHIQGAQRLSMNDIALHAKRPNKLFPFIDPDGYLVTSDHIAYMSPKQRKSTARPFKRLVLGNVSDKPVAEVLLKKLLFKNFADYIDGILKKETHENKPVLQKVIMALYYYSQRDIDKARSIMDSLDLGRGIGRWKEQAKVRAWLTVVNQLYHFFMNTEDLDIKSFMIDCVGEERFHSSTDIFRPDIKTAFEILNMGKNVRKKFEKLMHWHGRIPYWKENLDSSSNTHCPFYSVFAFGDIAGVSYIEDAQGEREYMTLGSRTIVYLGKAKTESEAIKQFARSYELAKAGICVYPLGILRIFSKIDTEKPYYCVDEYISWSPFDIELFNILKYGSLEDAMRSLGTFAAKVDKTSLRLDMRPEDKVRLGNHSEYNVDNAYLGDLCLRENNQWILRDHRLLSNDISLPTAKELLLQDMKRSVQKLPNEIAMYAGVKRRELVNLIEKSFLDGYFTEMAVSEQESDVGSSTEDVTPESEQIHAVTFNDQVKLLKAEKEKSLDFIALGTSGMKGYKKGTDQHKALNPLITKLRSYCEKRDIKFTCGNPRTVYEKVGDWKRENKNARGIVLDSEDSIDKLIDKLKKLNIDLETDENVLLAGVDNKNMEENSYIRLMEMLSLTLELLRKGEIDKRVKAIQASQKHLGFKQRGPRRISFEPISPIDYELKNIYRLQADKLDKAA